jgi:AraC-like DNA-binding protein
MKMLAERLPLGIPALVEELQGQGIQSGELFREAGFHRESLGEMNFEPADVPVILRVAERLSRSPDTALLAGQRQKISHFGVFGFALITSDTFGDAFRFGQQHIDLAGAVFEVDFQIIEGTASLKTRHPMKLGKNLRFIAEYWRSSMTTLLSEVLGAPFPSTEMFFPYSRPLNVELYQRLFGCKLHFDADVMEWRFDASVLEEPCPNADPLTSHLCQEVCDRLVTGDHQSLLIRSIRNLCIAKSNGAFATAESVAYALDIPLRTFHRRLAEQGTSFKKLLDETRFSLAAEYLKNTSVAVDEISSRCGYSDVSNFRKAFGRWAGLSPTEYRQQTR